MYIERNLKDISGSSILFESCSVSVDVDSILYFSINYYEYIKLKIFNKNKEILNEIS
jgi:hypothetical protein